MLKYRRRDGGDWNLMPETTSRYQAVTELDDNSIYEFIVAAKYEGGELGPESEPAWIRTNVGMHCVCAFKIQS